MAPSYICERVCPAPKILPPPINSECSLTSGIPVLSSSSTSSASFSQHVMNDFAHSLVGFCCHMKCIASVLHRWSSSFSSAASLPFVQHTDVSASAVSICVENICSVYQGFATSHKLLTSLLTVHTFVNRLNLVN